MLPCCPKNTCILTNNQDCPHSPFPNVDVTAGVTPRAPGAAGAASCFHSPAPARQVPESLTCIIRAGNLEPIPLD